MDVSNASLYDGGSAAAEAVLMAISATDRHGRVRRRRAACIPNIARCLATYLANLGVELVDASARPDGTISPGRARCARSTTRRPACWCSIRTSSAAWKTSRRWPRSAHDAGRMLVVAVDPISLGLLKRPGDYGADIVVAEGQSLGTPM